MLLSKQRALDTVRLMARDDARPSERTIGQVVGRNLAELREARGQTQREAATFLRGFGLSWTAANIASIESGRRESIDVGALHLLALAYDVRESRLFEGEGEV